MTDFIVVGQGLAGSILSLSLLKSGYTVSVIDKPNLSTCSKVAAGIWNPVVFKRLTKSWLADDVLPDLFSFYKECELLYNTSLIQERTIIKPFTEEQEQVLWLKKAQAENTFLNKDILKNYQLTSTLSIPNYSLVVKAGNLNVTSFLNLTREYLKQQQSYINEQFNYEELQNHQTHYSYKSINAKHVVFCEGHLMSKNPYFNWVPIKPAKGETLTIKCEALNLGTSIINKGVYILPLGNHTFKIGATYEWDDLSDIPTEKGKQTLIQKITTLFSDTFEIINHDAGVRPSVIDRRPVIGEHPEVKNTFIFNGFGTKAVMLAPFFANQFIEYLKGHTTLNQEVVPSRFYKK